MKKVELSKILEILCEDLGLTPEYSTPISYATFRRVMLANDLIVSEPVIKTKWEQIISNEPIISSIGKKTNGDLLITLNVHAVRQFFMAKTVTRANEKHTNKHKQTTKEASE